MEPTDKIERLIKETKYSADAATRKHILDDATAAMAETQGTASAESAIWRTIMRSKITKLTVAAVVIITVGLLLYRHGGTIDVSTVAWADVAAKIINVDHVHFYEFKSRNGDIDASLEGWFSDGLQLVKKENGNVYLDDGINSIMWDKTANKVREEKSIFGKINSSMFFDAITKGLFKFDQSDLLRAVPKQVGVDFLIYEFNAPKAVAAWAEKINITVGRNSLLPVQMKIIRKNPADSYDLFIFDYDESKKSEEFFKKPDFFSTVTGWQEGRGQGVMDGNEIIIHLQPIGPISVVKLKLYQKSFEKSGALKVYDLAVVTEEGYEKLMSRQFSMDPNTAGEMAVGTSDWPDKKFRNIRIRSILSKTEQKGVYAIKIKCLVER